MKAIFEESLWKAKSCKCNSLNVHCEGPWQKLSSFLGVAREEELETTVAIFWYPEASPMGGEAVLYICSMFLVESTLSCGQEQGRQEKARYTQLQ